MSAMMILKIFSDCCICFAILGSGPVVFAVPLLLPALGCGIASGIAAFFDRKGWDVLRRICCVLPLGCLLLAEGTGQFLILAVPAVYTAAVILRGELELEYSSYRHFFVRSLVLLGAVYLISQIWLFLTMIASADVLKPDGAVILRYGLVHLLCGVVLQRQLRLGVGYRAEGGRKQMAMLLGTATAIVAGFLLAEPLLRKGFGALLREVIVVILTPFAFLMDLAGKLFALMQRTEEDKIKYQEFLDHMASVGLGGVGDRVENGTTPPQQTFDGTGIWVALMVIVLIVCAVLVLRSFHKRTAETASGEITGKVLSAPKKKREPTLSNRNRVRQYYRDFLREEKNMGMRLCRSDTSERVLGRIHARTDRPSAEQLRQVYLQARYDQRKQISREQVEQAKIALRGTRKTKK